MNVEELKKICTSVRIETLNSIVEAGSGHIGGSFSMVEMLVALYFEVMNIDPAKPKKNDRVLYCPKGMHVRLFMRFLPHVVSSPWKH